ncbi:MAG: ThuA domain-containing protein [Planctomycetota bacterium]|nr:ThuA domain-containing protein [Planctomycetota bacterium]
MRIAICLMLALTLLCGTMAAGEPAAAPPPPLKVCLVSASAEYKSDETLAEFQKFLEAGYNAACTRVFGGDKGTSLPGLEAIDSCDVMVLFTRRVTLPDDQLARVKKYFQAGKPLVGLRTASHAFQNWLEFDKEVLGGNYNNHYGAGPVTKVSIAEKAKEHPILAGVGPFTSTASLYKNEGAAADIELLLSGTITDPKEKKEVTHPLAWTRVHNSGRVFYTSLGAPEDFANENFRRMIVNALFWTAKRPVEAKAAAPAK